MNNPFAKQDNGNLIAAIALGAVVTGVLSWLLLTGRGAKIRTCWKESLKEKSKDIIAEILSEQTGVSKKITKPATDIVVD